MNSLVKKIEALRQQIVHYDGLKASMEAALARLQPGVDRDILEEHCAALAAYRQSLQAIVDRYSNDSSSVTA